MGMGAALYIAVHHTEVVSFETFVYLENNRNGSAEVKMKLNDDKSPASPPSLCLISPLCVGS